IQLLRYLILPINPAIDLQSATVIVEGFLQLADRIIKNCQIVEAGSFAPLVLQRARDRERLLIEIERLLLVADRIGHERKHVQVTSFIVSISNGAELRKRLSQRIERLLLLTNRVVGPAELALNHGYFGFVIAVSQV